VTRSRLLACLIGLALAVPSAAFAQGAGDDQYQDPFGDEPAQTGGGSGNGGGGGGGLADTPPGGGSAPAPDPGAGSEGTAPSSPEAGPAQNNPNRLPNTGADPRALGLAGMVLLLAGLGLRLRTIDPNAY
jgi:LPXTG-motif cell wall-anchored protein